MLKEYNTFILDLISSAYSLGLTDAMESSNNKDTLIEEVLRSDAYYKFCPGRDKKSRADEERSAKWAQERGERADLLYEQIEKCGICFNGRDMEPKDAGLICELLLECALNGRITE